MEGWSATAAEARKAVECPGLLRVCFARMAACRRPSQRGKIEDDGSGGVQQRVEHDSSGRGQQHLRPELAPRDRSSAWP